MSQSGETPLITAANNGDKAIVQHLIDHKAKLDAANKHGDTALHRAAYQFHTAVVKLLVKAGASLDVPNKVYTFDCVYVYAPYMCMHHICACIKLIKLL